MGVIDVVEEHVYIAHGNGEIINQSQSGSLGPAVVQ